MSFGFQNRVALIDEALHEAISNHALLFAAAANCGGNDKPSWPVIDERIMCIHAADGEGNPCETTPSAFPRRDNFAVLGSSVRAAWVPNPDGSQSFQYKSGTSTAAPIAAGIAACIIDLLQRARTPFIRSRPDFDEENYDRNLKALRRRQGMGDVFNLMVNERRDYQYVIPWRLFGNPALAMQAIVSNIRAVL
jgi:hypothetical protein